MLFRSVYNAAGACVVFVVLLQILNILANVLFLLEIIVFSQFAHFGFTSKLCFLLGNGFPPSVNGHWENPFNLIDIDIVILDIALLIASGTESKAIH